jgi:hypothetical protein
MIKLPKKPLTWSDLIEHRKYYVHTQKLVDFEDKVKSKEIVAALGCPVPKNYWIGKSAINIPFDKLPKMYVAKPSHYASSKGVFLMKNGRNLFNGKQTSLNEIRMTLQRYMSIKISSNLNEWATTKIPRRIIIEELLPNTEGEFQVQTDYKCYVFHGRVCMVRVDYDRLKKYQSVDYHDRDYNLITFDPIRDKYPHKSTNGDLIKKPIGYDLMIELVERIGREFGDFIRIDMYLTSKGPVFGEATIYPGSGKLSGFTLLTDMYMGALWQNPELVLGEGEKPFTKDHFVKVLNILYNPIKNTNKTFKASDDNKESDDKASDDNKASDDDKEVVNKESVGKVGGIKYTEILIGS